MMVDTKACREQGVNGHPQPGRIRTILARHGEKLAFAAAAAALAGYLSLGVAFKREDPHPRRLADLALHSQREAGASHSDLAPAKPPPLDALEPFTHTASITPVHDWAGSYRTEIVLTPVGTPGRKPPAMPSFTLTRADASEGAVALAWQSKPADAESREVAIELLRLERRKEGGPWQCLDLLAPGKPDTVDLAVEPQATYSYRVVPITTDKEWIEKHTSGAGLPSNELSAATPALWKVTIVTANPKEGTACLTITRYADGVWTKSQSNHTVGSSAVLKKIDEATVRMGAVFCETTFVNGNKACRPVDSTYLSPTARLTLVDDRGLTVVRLRTESRITNKLCQRHAVTEALAEMQFALADGARMVDATWAAAIEATIDRSTMAARRRK